MPKAPILATRRPGEAWTGVRFREDVGFEMRCESCAHKAIESYWPLDLEFWSPSKGMTRCRACWNEYEAARKRRLTASARNTAAKRKYQREWAARKRVQERAAEGREKYERRAA